MPASSAQCARDLLDSVFLVMQAIRAEMRSLRAPGLTVPQFRTLVFLGKYPGGALSELAEHIGLTVPSASKMIDSLVLKALVSRRASARDRRRVELSLTPQGRAILRRALRGAQAALARRLDCLSSDERQAVSGHLALLRGLFAQPVPARRRPRPGPLGEAAGLRGAR